MLLNNFFYITSLQTEGAVAKAVLELNAAHTIFEGHFPGQPIVPGVCMMQMVKEIVEQVIGKKTGFVKADQLKFLSVINPLENKFIQMDMKMFTKDETIAVDAQLSNGTTTFFKFKGSFPVEV